MPKRPRTPKYCHHKSSGQAYVRLDGEVFYLGKWGTSASHAEYDRRVAGWIAAGRRLPVRPGGDPTVTEVFAAYYRHAEAYYVKDGRPTGELERIRRALRFAREPYGDTPAAEFGPMALKAVRQRMIEHVVTRTVKVRDPRTGEVREEQKVLRRGLSRIHVNHLVGCLKRAFAWAVAEELLPGEVAWRLARVKGLRRGRSGARESARVLPVPAGHTWRAMRRVLPAVRHAAALQRLCGARPGEVLAMRPREVDRTGEVWIFRPGRYKTEHHDGDGDGDGAGLAYPLGPRARRILAPYLEGRAPEAYLFSPREALAAYRARRRARRRSKVQPGPRARRQGQPRRQPGDRYLLTSYEHAIRAACARAGIPPWHPHQLRHSYLTEVRRRYGIEAARAAVGHRNLSTTEIYAERDRTIAERIAREMG